MMDRRTMQPLKYLILAFMMLVKTLSYTTPNDMKDMMASVS